MRNLLIVDKLQAFFFDIGVNASHGMMWREDASAFIPMKLYLSQKVFSFMFVNADILKIVSYDTLERGREIDMPILLSLPFHRTAVMKTGVNGIPPYS